MLLKLARATLTRDNFVEPEIALNTTGATEQFKKLVAEIKRVAPRSDEFTYFRCIAIHAMEAANLDEHGVVINKGHITEADGKGNCKICGAALVRDPRTGEPVEGMWCSASGIEPYINQNGDAFPERELVSSYKSFVGRGLFVNHASDDAEKIRGIILDAAWIPKHKCVELLVAIDKVAFPELARQVEAGYSNDVSMGTQVAHSRCSKCGNKAVTEADYCPHIRSHKGMVLEGSKTYEVNNGLNFIEISIVSTGADPKAKIRQVLASLNTLMQNRVVEKTSTNENMTKLQNGINLIKEELKNIKGTLGGEATKEIEAELDVLQNNVVSIDNLEAKREGGAIDQVSKEIAALKNSIKEIESKLNTGGIQMTKEELTARAQSRRAYFQGGGGANEPQTYPVDPLGGPNGKAEKDRLAVEKSGENLKDGSGKELIDGTKEKLMRAELAERAQKRRAYFQGTVEPVAPGKVQYTPEPMGGPNGTAEKARLAVEKSGENLKDGAGKELTDGTKEKLMRAKLRAKFTTASEKKDCAWTVYAGDEPVITASVEQLYGKEIDAANKDDKTITNWDWVSSRAYGLEVIKACREIGISKTAEMMGLTKKAEGPADLDLNLEGPAGAAPAEPAADAAPAVEAPAVAEPVPTETVASVPEALEKIEDAVNEIRALEGEEESAESIDLGEGLEEAGEELKGLEAVPAATASSDKFRTVMAEAIGDALLRVKKAELYIEARKSEMTKKLEKLEEKCKKLQEKKKAAEGKAEKEDLDEKISACQEKIKALKKQMADKEKAKMEKKEKKTTKKAEAEMCEKCSKAKGECTCEKAAEASLEARAQARRVAAGLVEGTAAVQNLEKETKEATQAVKELGSAVKEVKKDLTSALEARSKARWAAAESLYGVTPAFDAIKDAHPQGGTTTEDGTGKAIPAANDGAHVETVTEQQKIDEQIVDKTPRGELTARQRARRELVANLEQTTAAVDTDAKKYWAQFYGEGDAASKTFGKDMATEKKASVATADTKLKMKRAYQVALKQQEVGQVAPGRPALEAQVDNLMEMDDAGFASFAKAVDNTFPVKKAEADKATMVRSAGAVAVGVDDNQDDLPTQLSKLNWRIS